MVQIIVEKPTDEQLASLGIDSWSDWGCEPKTFDWEYSMKEIAYVKEGKVTVDTDEGSVTFGAGDLVTFPKGLQCTWHVHETIRKVYTFE